ncbi:MAG: CbiX/SirB N-terminal domain-containing protein [Bacteroidetes bacterium]|nr:CbiX/SirB N-terminal domain-containing protein [Bacteroidota bacterium]
MEKLFLFILSGAIAFSFSGCKHKGASTHSSSGKKIGLLLVNHGSRSETWRNALLDLEKQVTDSVLKDGKITGIKTAFMEYTEPSIATRLKEFDQEGFTDVVLVPVFLTVSPHTFDDIPTIIGQKEDPQSKEMLKLEKIERYTPKASIHITPMLDFTKIVKTNVLRRVKYLSVNPAEEGLVLIGYGDETYHKDWLNLFDEIGTYVNAEKGLGALSSGWCGHVAGYNSDSTTVAIERILRFKKRAVVVPVLVAHDEMFQVKIIGDGINKIKDSKTRVLYKPDAILPDSEVRQWVIDITRQFAGKI